MRSLNKREKMSHERSPRCVVSITWGTGMKLLVRTSTAGLSGWRTVKWTRRGSGLGDLVGDGGAAEERSEPRSSRGGR